MLDFLQKPKTEIENYWALLIEPESITSAIWCVVEGQLKIVNSTQPTRWDSKSIDEKDLIEGVDASLSLCMQNMPEDFVDPTKTVFGVPNDWIADGNIKNEYLIKLKKICDELSLTPSGFVVLSEAISHFIKQEEGVSFGGITVGVNTETIDISIFNLGKLQGSTTVFRSVSIEEDVTEGLSRLAVEGVDFPTRIILYNQNEKEMEDAKNYLNDVNWGAIGNSKFIHPPKIELLDIDKKILAIALAGGAEFGNVVSIKEVSEEEINNIEEPNDVTAEDFGFTVNSHVENIVLDQPVQEKIIQNPPIQKIRKMFISLPRIRIPKFDFSFFKNSKFSVMLLSLVVTMFVVGVSVWWFLPKATVTIYVSPKTIEEKISINIGDQLKSEEVEVLLSKEKTKSTTGTKVVGEKAKGSVKIQNGTAFPINLPVGTLILSSSDLRFVTTKLASVSGAVSPSSPGTAVIEVEALSIGSEYNLNKDETFKVSNYPKAEVDATSTDAFIGGSSRQISSVSEDDKNKLLKELKGELLSEGSQKLQEQIDNGQYLIGSSIKIEVEEEKYSNKVGDEATNLKLLLDVKIKALTVSESDLAKIAREAVNSKIPNGFVLRDDQIKYNFELSNSEEEFSTAITANLLPSIDPKNISEQISGKYINIAEDYLRSIPGYTNAEVRIWPNVKGITGTLPHVSKNIVVEITAE